MEDAKEHQKELWILTQDMAKAYDSIIMEGLCMSLDRIGIPLMFTNWIINLFAGRSMQVITAFGLSSFLNAADGIDQGDSIFPLLWRIFYNPLLCTLQQDHQRGYCMNIFWPSHVHNQKEWKNYDLIVPAQAYMDDTSFLRKNYQDLQASIDIANQFYKLHDIFINGKKCNLIVINPSISQALRSVIIGQDYIVVKTTTKEIRYLGIWISAKQSKKQWMNRLKIIVNQFLKTWNKKVLGVRHLAYIINRVLILRLVYVSQLMTLNETDWEIIFSPVLQIIKKHLRVTKSFPTAAIFHEEMTGIDSLWQ